MMVSQPERVCLHAFSHDLLLTYVLQWVDDMAAAGGSSYTFHYEATGSSHTLIVLAFTHTGL
jgi:pentose-5-phosphate-3-epimerase